MSAGRVWTEQTVRELGLSTDLVTAASVLGIGRSAAYAMARAGTFPVPLVRVGRLYRVPVAHLLHLLGLITTDTTDPPAAPVQPGATAP